MSDYRGVGLERFHCMHSCIVGIICTVHTVYSDLGPSTVNVLCNSVYRNDVCAAWFYHTLSSH